MKLTTHPSQACVETMTQSSQLIDSVFMRHIVSGGCDSNAGKVSGVASSRAAGTSLSGMIHAFVLIDATPARLADLAIELAETDGVSEVYSVSGKADIVAVVRVRRHEDLADIVTRHIAGLDGIVSTSTLIAFQAYRRSDLDAIFEVGATATQEVQE